MQYCKKCWRELRQLNRSALFSVATNILESSFDLVNISMLGHLGKGNLAAGAIAMILYKIVWVFVEGSLSAQDTLVSKAAALHDSVSIRYWSYVSLLFTLSLCGLSSIVFLFSPLIIPYGFLVSGHLTDKAIAHVFLLLPAFWCHGLFRVAQKYLQSQLIIFPALACTVFGICINVLGTAAAQIT